MKKKTTGKENCVQLSLFNDLREWTDEELANELAGKELEPDTWDYNDYRLESLFNQLTPHRARIAAAAVELYKRKEVHRRRIPKAMTSRDIYDFMEPLLSDLPHEEFWLLTMNNRLQVIDKRRMFVGGVASTLVDVRLIFRHLVMAAAKSFAVVHNHPSGNLKPSRDDDNITAKLAEAARIFGMQLLDHVIIGDGDYYSYADEGKL